MLLNTWHLVGYVHPITWPAVVATFAGAAPFDLLHAAATVVFLAALYAPWRKKLDRIVRKYALVESRGESGAPCMDDVPAPARPVFACRPAPRRRPAPAGRIGRACCLELARRLPVRFRVPPRAWTPCVPKAAFGPAVARDTMPPMRFRLDAQATQKTILRETRRDHGDAGKHGGRGGGSAPARSGGRVPHRHGVRPWRGRGGGAQPAGPVRHQAARPGKPVAWLVGDASDLERYGREVPDVACALARAHWPGPLTLVVKASQAVPPAFRSAEGTIGLRMPDSETALALVRAAGGPVATTSANLSGGPAPRTFEELDPALVAAAAAAVRDDARKSGVASTVVDCTGEGPVVLREGALTQADVRALS